jgi:uncharacterized 2Fe-2S/4Fe-4S cluster protein (DUF4445 family)
MSDISLIIDNQEAKGSIGDSIFECAETIQVSVPTSCFKQGKCRECLVEIEEGAELLTELTPQESHLGGRFRLACRTRFAEPGVVRCHTLKRGSLRIETETSGLEIEGNIIPPDNPLAMHPTAYHGIAIDIGTTTVALRLYDLRNGLLIATQSFENPQRFGGSDIMARIHFDGANGGRLLQRTLLGYLTRALIALPVDPARIGEVVVVGNPTMRDLFFGLDVQMIGVIPYRSLTEAAFREGTASTSSLKVPARKLRLPVYAEAHVYGLPLIGSHVGADAAACLLATGIADGDEICAILDIGTNTEAIIGNRHRLMAASCPAGPAFEGGGVVFGMPALDGAIERIHLNGNSIETTTIGNGKPSGICGSGLIDLLSEMLRTDRMNEQGRFADEGEVFMVDPEQEIFFSEADVNELAQAKGANAAGLRVLAETYGIAISQIDRLYLAGGFSRHLDVDASCRIGLIPDLPRDRIVKVGNAALHGAAMALLSIPQREKIEDLVKRVEHVRLETNPNFFDFFVEGCQFARFGNEQ